MSLIEIRNNDRLCEIILNRPEKKNALNANLIKELHQALKNVKDNPQIKLIMLSGAGENFCAGADLNGMANIAKFTPDDNYRDAQALADVLYELYNYPKPTVAIARGAVMGGGIGLLACCDIAMATEDAYFAFSEVKLGLTPSIISPYILSAIGERNLRYYFLTAERFDAKKAQQMGLVHQVLPVTNYHNQLKELCENISNNGPQALAQVKQLIRMIKYQKIDETLTQKTAEHLAELRITQEAKEGIEAFLKKRTANWTN